MADFRNILLNVLKITDPELPQNFFCDEKSGINQIPPEQMCRMVLCRSLLVPNELCFLGFFSRLSTQLMMEPNFYSILATTQGNLRLTERYWLYASDSNFSVFTATNQCTWYDSGRLCDNSSKMSIISAMTYVNEYSRREQEGTHTHTHTFQIKLIQSHQIGRHRDDCIFRRQFHSAHQLYHIIYSIA